MMSPEAMIMVFLVDGGGGQPQPSSPPSLVPCWSFPPAQETVRRREKSRGCMGVGTGAAVVVLLLLLLVFASLGIGVVWIKNLQTDLKEMKRMVKTLNKSTEDPSTQDTLNAPQKQIGGHEPWAMKKKVKEERPSAHVTGNFTNAVGKTLLWVPVLKAGGVEYSKDGGLQINESGLYHIYSRVEFIFKDCSTMTTFNHAVFVRRLGNKAKLMEAIRPGFCTQEHGRAHAWTVDSYLGSAQELEKYDKVFVNVSHPTLLSHEPYGTFFGLYKL